MTTTRASETNSDPPNLGGLDDFIQQEMAGWKVPGLALAVVKDSVVIHSAGYGQRDRENSLPVTPKTVFPIASVTKSLTVATLAGLARQGKLEWDRPVREYLPDFRLFDPVATERLTPRDLVTHRSGLPRHDYVWYGASLSRQEIYARLRYLEPSKDLRTTYQYNNLMFMTAGYLAGQLLGTTWEKAVQRTLFAPLGMRRSSFAADILISDDFARPYQKDDEENVHQIPYYHPSGSADDPLGPAGSINSCVEDLIRYVQMHLDQGRSGKKQVLSAQDAVQMQSPQMVIPDGLTFPELGHAQYGMGFQIMPYRGHKMVHHGGNIDGFSAMLAFLPQKKIGVVVLCNLSGTYLRNLLPYRIFDQLLDLEFVPWSARFHDLVDKGKASEEAAKNQGLTPRKPNTHPAHPLDDYAGTYEHPAYGTVRIKIAEGQTQTLEIDFHGFTSPLHHFHYDVFATPIDKLNRLERLKVRFETDWNGDISALRIPFEPQVADIVFTVTADPAMQTRSFLEPLAGEYAIGAITFQVTLQEDGALQILFPGQTPRTLRPVRGNTFDLQGLSGYRLEFQRAENGQVTALALYQPNGNFVAERKR